MHSWNLFAPYETVRLVTASTRASRKFLFGVSCIQWTISHPVTLRSVFTSHTLLCYSVSSKYVVSNLLSLQLFFLHYSPPPPWARASPFPMFLDHNQQRTTVGRTPLDEWSACRRDLYLTTHNNHNRQTTVGFEPTISAGERLQTTP
jgi:hypothetical protein